MILEASFTKSPAIDAIGQPIQPTGEPQLGGVWLEVGSDEVETARLKPAGRNGPKRVEASGANLTFESRLRLGSFSNVKFIKLH